MEYCESINLMQSAFNSQSNIFEMVFYKPLERADVQVEPEWSSLLTSGSWSNVNCSYEGDENAVKNGK